MALIELNYCSNIGVNRAKTVIYDDVMHKVVSGSADSIPSCVGQVSPQVLYEHVYYDAVSGQSWLFSVHPAFSHPYAYVLSAPVQYVPKPVIDSINVTPATPPQKNGVVEVVASGGSPPFQYRLNNGNYQSSNVFTGLAPGEYVVTVRDSLFNSVSEEAAVGPIGDVKITNIDVVDATAEEGGIITITATASEHPIYYSIDGGNTWDWRNIYADLAPGSYRVFARDDTGAVDSMTVYVHQPFVSVAEPFIGIPEVNALRFVFPSAKGFAGLLHAQEVHPGFYQKPYFLPVQQSDPTVIQIQSSYDSNVLEVRSLDGLLVHTFSATKKSSNLGQEVTASAVLEAFGSGKTKMLFNRFEDAMPEAAKVGGLVRIGNTTHMNGVYTVAEVVAPTYLVVNMPYLGTGPNATCKATFLDSVLPYEVCEFEIDWNEVLPGKYKLIMKGSMDGSTYEATSEPIDLRPSHKGTVLVSWKNIDNNYGIDYTTGIEHVIRFAGKFFERTSAGQKETHRDSKNRLIKVSAWKQRRVKLEAWRLPPWVHERLELAFDHDYFTVNGVEYQTGEDYDWTYYEDYSLVDGEIMVTQVNDYFNENSDDSGDVDTGYLRVNEGYLKI